jgi:DNA polymerase I
VRELDTLPFSQIWAVDFEFRAEPGNRPDPVCLVAWELRSGTKLRLWRDQFGTSPPYPIGPNALFIAYYASAEIGCHLALGWPKPARILDLFTEYRCQTNGLPLLVPEAPPARDPLTGRKRRIGRHSLLGALANYGLDSIGVVEKEAMRALVLRGGPWTRHEQQQILDYCESDVEALARLLSAVLNRSVDLRHALLRGRYMAAAAAMEHTGIPIDRVLYDRLRNNWESLKGQLIARVDVQYGVFEGLSFRRDRFAAWLVRSGIPWPRLESGALALDEETFSEMSMRYPVLKPLHDLLYALSDLRLNDLAVGDDNRNRTILSAFRAKTGRNQPGNSEFVFGPARWLRGLIKPPPGYRVAYVDWEQQEFGIAAVLSGDPNMLEAYLSGDCYLAFGKQAGLIPPGGTKDTHANERELCKRCVLGVQYGMTEFGLAMNVGGIAVARRLLRAHWETYRVFWRWSDRALDHAMITGSIHTVFGWTLHLGSEINPRSLRNFPMQANGAEMLRLAVCLATERGIEVCAPVHDAVVVAAPVDQIEVEVIRMQDAMCEASSVVLSGFKLRTQATIVRYPQRYMDPRGVEMWNMVCALLDETEAAA